MRNISDKMTAIMIWPLSAVLIFTSYVVTAKSMDGKDLMEQRQAHNSGWHSSKVALEMILIMPTGETSLRKMRNMTLEVLDDGDKSLSVFDEPNDVSGVAFLNHSYVAKMDNQWLYLPSMKRVKRISSNNKSSAFMGSEFSYEDMSSFEVGRYTYGAVVKGDLNGKSSFIVESTPNYQSSGYSQMKTWLDPEHYQPLQVEFYDKRGGLLKRLALKDYKQYENGAWRAHKLEMDNVQNGRKTVLSYQSFDFKAKLAEKDFEQSVLQRVR